MSVNDRQEQANGFFPALLSLRQWWYVDGRRFQRRFISRAYLGLGFAFCLGLGLFVFAPGATCTTLPRLTAHPKSFHNLVLGDYGPTICVSSYFHEVDGQHHPAFLVDGQAFPTKVEKWASARSDPAPWAEIRWGGVHSVSAVTIKHGGAYEESHDTASNYVITCLTNSRRDVKLKVTGNRAAISTHSIACSDALGIRINFAPMPNRNITRVFEIEVLGQ